MDKTEKDSVLCCIKLNLSFLNSGIPWTVKINGKNKQIHYN